MAADLVPIIEPEIDIRSPEKAAAEELLKTNVVDQLTQLDSEQLVMLKFSLPDVDDFYADLVSHPKVLRVVALSGGYGRNEADARLAANHGVIASFSRALTEGLSVHQSKEEFDATLKTAIESILTCVPHLVSLDRSRRHLRCRRATCPLRTLDRFDHRAARPDTLKAKTISCWRCISKTEGGHHER